MAETKFQVETAYHSISDADNDSSDNLSNRPKIELGSHPQIKEHRSWVTTIIWQTIALAWLVPIVMLLYWNFTNYIIGASAWCPDTGCYLNAFNGNSEVPQERMRQYDKNDHDLLGALQFVAKGLEVWFTIIAAALMYLITMEFAGKKEGLPVGYLTRPTEFADLVGLFDPLLWKTGPTPLRVKSAGEKKLGRRVWALIALSVFLCILINLMGPATAVLAIPSLNWMNTPDVGSRQFSQLNAGSPPVTGPEGWVWWQSYNCNNTNFQTQNYSCLQYPFGVALDSWIQSAIGFGGASTGYTMQDGLTFETNETYQSSTDNSLQQFRQQQSDSSQSVWSDIVWWAPSRQIVSNLSTDYSVISYISQGLSEERITNIMEGVNSYPDPTNTYVEYNKSLELQVRRNGPVIGSMMNKYVDYNNAYHFTVEVDAGRQVRCYIWYNLWNAQFAEGTTDATQNYTKCIRTGAGWSDLNKHTSFSAAGGYDTTTKRLGPSIDVNIYSSDRAVFLPNGTLPSWFPAACLAQYGTRVNTTTCDWNRLFTTDVPPDVANRTQYVNTIEYNMQIGNQSVMMAADFVAYRAFTTYALDPFPFSNPMGLVQTDNLPTTGDAFPIDPAWLLAGYSTDRGGALLANRTTTTLLVDVMNRLLSTGEGVNLGLSDDDWKIDLVSFLPIMHTLTMIDHSTTFVPEGTTTTDQDHPILLRNARIYVWSYGLQSRTSILGAVVAIAGAVVVLWQFVLGFVDRRRYRSPTQLVVAALEHCPRGEFEGKQHDETAMARVRFHIKDDSGHTGKFSFYEPDS